MLCRNSGSDRPTDRATTSLSSLTSAWVSRPFFCITSVKYILRIQDVYTGTEFFHPGSRVKKIPDPGALAAQPDPYRSFLYNCQVTKLPVLRIRDVYPGSRILIFYPPRIQKQQQKRGVKNLLSYLFL